MSINMNPALNRRSLIAGVAGLGAAGILAGCSGNAGTDAGSAAASGSAFKIGSIGPKTGATASYGISVTNGAELGCKDFSVDGLSFEYKSEDSTGNAETAVNAYNTLADWGMQALVGPTLTGPSVSVADQCNTDRTFMITPSASSEDVTANKDCVFQVCFTDPNQGKTAANYIKDNNLGTKIAAIYNNSDAYSTGIYNAFAEEAEAIGLEVVTSQTFPDDKNTDFTVQLSAAKEAGADLVFMPIYYTPASLILNQAKTMGYAPTFFGCDGMDGILDLEGFDTSLAEGLMLMTPFNAWGTDERTVNFVTTYQGQYDGIPNQFAADGYDCIYAIYEACQKAGITADTSAADVCEALVSTFTSEDFSVDGLTGTGMTWSSTGEVSKAPVVVKVEGGVYVTQ